MDRFGQKRIKEFALRRGMASGCKEPVAKKEKCENLYHQGVRFSVFSVQFSGMTGGGGTVNQVLHESAMCESGCLGVSP
jgi:hypothetical protein